MVHQSRNSAISFKLRRFRSLLVESLEPRQLFAIDIEAFAASHSTAAPLSNSAQSAYARFLPASFELQSIKTSEVSPQLQKSIANALDLSKQTFAPESTLQSFQSSTPNLDSVQPMLVGSGMGSKPDWNQVTSAKSASNLQPDDRDSPNQILQIVGGGFASSLLPKTATTPIVTPVASVLSAEQYRAMQPDSFSGWRHVERFGQLFGRDRRSSKRQWK